MEKIIEANLRHSLWSIHPAWKPLFKQNIGALRDTLTNVVNDIPVDKITPPLQNIFKAFLINPKDIKVIIIGQDPYPKKGDANGLAFSTNANTTPASLKNIFKCLNRLGYITESNNLMNWMLQGVFLLNMALTTEIGNTKKHSQLWFPFISELISTLTLFNKNKKMSILLWGSDAQKMESYIKGKHHILKWSHPSPMADNQLIDDKKFINCDNFDNLKDIDWSTGKRICIYTDGSGRPDEDCASAVYIPNVLKMALMIKPRIYELTSSNNLISSSNKPPTSQRAEYLAVIYALWIAYKLNLHNVEIITDSYNAYGIIVEWTKRKEEKYENTDLVKIMRYLYELIKERVCIKRVLSHNKSNSEYNEGNNIVDKLAFNHFKKYNSTKVSDEIKYGIEIEYHHIELFIH